MAYPKVVNGDRRSERDVALRGRDERREVANLVYTTNQSKSQSVYASCISRVTSKYFYRTQPNCVSRLNLSVTLVAWRFQL